MIELPETRKEFDRRPFVVRTDACELDELFAARVARGDGLTLRIVMRHGDRCRESHPALGQEVRHELLHLRQLCVVGFVPDGALTHHDPAHSGVAYHEARVDAEPAFELGQVFPERGPIPADALREALEGHAFDARQHAHQIARGACRERGDTEAAISAQNRRDAMKAGRAEDAVPEDLGVVMRMHVDEAGADDLTRRIE